MPSYILKIHGNVQGVCYRDFAQRNAKIQGITGWVKNEPDGTVTAFIQGEENKIQKFIEILRNDHSGATVENITIKPAPHDPAIKTFLIA